MLLAFFKEMATCWELSRVLTRLVPSLTKPQSPLATALKLAPWVLVQH